MNTVVWRSDNTRWIVLPALIFLLSGCSTLSIDAAKAISSTGRGIAAQAKQNTFVSGEEYLRARDSEALFHGYSGSTATENYVSILSLNRQIHNELIKRAVVFERLIDVYETFGDLAALDVSKETEAAISNLGGAINEYAGAVRSAPPVSHDATGAISKIGGIFATEVHKQKLREASIQIRTLLGSFHGLLSTALVRQQMQGFKQYLDADRSTAVRLLWQHGVYDPTTLLNEIGSDLALTAQKDASGVIRANAQLSRAMTEVISQRLAQRSDLIEQSYDVTLSSIAKLISEHKKLEEGNGVDLASLREQVSKLREIALLLSKTRAATITTP